MNQDTNEDTSDNLSGLESQAYVQCSQAQTPEWALKNMKLLSEFEQLQHAIRGEPRENENVSV